MNKLQSARKAWESAYIYEALKRNEWSVSATAQDLEMERASLYVVIKRLGLVRPRDYIATTSRIDAEAGMAHNPGDVHAQERG